MCLASLAAISSPSYTSGSPLIFDITVIFGAANFTVRANSMNSSAALCIRAEWNALATLSFTDLRAPAARHFSDAAAAAASSPAITVCMGEL